MADETVDGAVENSAEAELAPESSSSEEATSGEVAADEGESANGPLEASEVYKVALALYLEGDAEAALQMIEDAKDREDLDDRLKGKLDVLKRRANKQATRRFARPTKPILGEDPAAGEEASGALIKPKSEAGEAEESSGDDSADASEPEAEASEPEAEASEPEAEASEPEAEADAEASEAEAEASEPEAEVADEAEAEEATEGEAEATEGEAEATEGEAEATEGEAEATEGEAEAETDEDASQAGEAESAEANETESETAASETEVGTAPPLESESSEIRSPLAETKAEAEAEAATEAATEAPTTESGRVASESGRVASESGRVGVEGDPRRPRGSRPHQAQRRPAQRPAPAGAPRGPGRRPQAAQARPPRGAPTANALARDLEKLQDNVERMAKSLRGVESHTMKVAEAYQRVARSGKRKEQAYDQLYVELRQYKDNFLAQAQKPLFKDLILLFDGVRRTARSYQESEEPLTKEAVVKSLEHLSDEILEMLYRRDIEQIEDYPDVLDIDFQKPVQRIETDDPSEDRKIEQVVREGFRMNGLVLRPQEVVVKRCTKEREA